LKNDLDLSLYSNENGFAGRLSIAGAAGAGFLVTALGFAAAVVVFGFVAVISILY
jgi:hypothetical protein